MKILPVFLLMSFFFTKPKSYAAYLEEQMSFDPPIDEYRIKTTVGMIAITASNANSLIQFLN